MDGRIGRLAGALVVSLLALAILAASACAASPFAPLKREGPKLRVDPEKLQASLVCSEGVADATRAPVLLVPATGVNSDQNFSWNYQPFFDMEGIPYCTSDQQGIRNSNLTDIQRRGQYLTYAIRTMHEMAGRKISIVGHSQGGMAMRWSLRFWPDTRAMVDDVIGFAGTNQGTTLAQNCDNDCSPAAEQQSSDSRFIAALNSRAETFASISYTEVFTLLDQTVMPQPGASNVSGPGRITNIAIQDVCPASKSEHLQVGTVDPAAAALALDALDHDGPADPSRIDPTVCAQPYMPGYDEATAPAKIASAIQSLFVDEGPIGPEPNLRCYVFRSGAECRAAKRPTRD